MEHEIEGGSKTPMPVWRQEKNHNNNKDNNNNIGNANSMHGTNRAVSTALGHVASKLSMRIYCVKQYE